MSATSPPRKARSGNRQGEKHRTDYDHPLPAEEIGRKAGNQKRQPEHGGEDRADRAELRVGHAERGEVDLDLRKRGIVELPRTELQEERHEQESEQQPLIGKALHLLRPLRERKSQT